MKRAKKCLKQLETSFGRLIRDLQRKFIEFGIQCERMKKILALAIRIFNQKRSNKNKIYSYHAPETKCIAKGKAHKRYEFGWIVGVKSFAENIYDGKTLADSLVQVKCIQGRSPDFAYVDRGYKGYTGNFLGTHIYYRGQRKGISKSTKNCAKESKLNPLSAISRSTTEWVETFARDFR